MSKKWDAIRGSAEFYVTIAVCLLVIGVSGYFLLFGGDDTAEEALAPPDETPVTSPAPELVVPEEPVVETIEPVEVPAATMPEVEVDDTPVIAQAPRLIVSPLEGEVLTAFSMDELVYNPTLEDWRTHNGIDIAAKEGEAVGAALAGEVTSAKMDSTLGWVVTLSHTDDRSTVYAGLSDLSVKEGDKVNAGQQLGTAGIPPFESDLGVHVHFEYLENGKYADPAEQMAAQ